MRDPKSVSFHDVVACVVVAGSVDDIARRAQSLAIRLASIFVCITSPSRRAMSSTSRSISIDFRFFRTRAN